MARLSDLARTKAMRLISAAADAGRPCPTNAELAECAGSLSTTTGALIVAQLEKLGAIAVERFNSDRRITVLATGRSTARRGLSTTPHWRSSANPSGPTPAGLTPREGATLALLTAAAEAGERCPGNAELGAALGIDRTTASNIVNRLMRKRAIALEARHGSHARVVTIVATGASTARPAEPEVKLPAAPSAPLTRAEALRAEVLAEVEQVAQRRALATVAGGGVNPLAHDGSAGDQTRPAHPGRRHDAEGGISPAGPSAAGGRPDSGRPDSVDRSPCPHCGVRGDIGCAHQRPGEIHPAYLRTVSRGISGRLVP